MYKHFFHWNVSKVGIAISRYIMALIFSLPFFVLCIVSIVISDYALLNPDIIMQDFANMVYPFSQKFMLFS